MRSRNLRTMRALSIALTLGLIGCAHPVTRPSILLTESDLTPAADPAKPKLPRPLPPVATTAAGERAYLIEAVIKPLMKFSIAQEQTTAAERQRAAGLVAKVKAFSAAPKKKWWPW